MMSIGSPNLDDRSFEDLVQAARQRIARSCPEWTDLSPGDPGMVLVEAFAYLTDILLYRLNRLPENVYRELLRLIGLRLQPPVAANVTLRFTLNRAQVRPVEIPRGTRVTTARRDSEDEPPVFVTLETATLDPGETVAEIPARHCELVDAELAGTGSGLPGLMIKVDRPPMIAATAGSKELLVGVETPIEDQESLSEPFILWGKKSFRIWREVENFSRIGDDRYVYMVDRTTGAIIFSPAARMKTSDGLLESERKPLAEFPEPNREIRVWYQCGGGAGGNVMADTLTTLKDPIPGITVTNPLPAMGGRAVESLENALHRGPQELHSLHRAVTARDFEHIARRASGAVDRAHAFTKAMLWSYARPGTVEVLLVPHIPDSLREKHGRVTLDILRTYETPEALEQIQSILDERKPLGTTCVVKWVHCKPVKVQARMTVFSEEDPAAVKSRVMERLWRAISPLTQTHDGKGWPFGRALTRWDIYRIIDEEPGVSGVSDIRLIVDEVPDHGVQTVCADAYQPDTWYAGAGEKVFRSTNIGDGWEFIGSFANERIVAVSPFPKRTGQEHPGLLAVATQDDTADNESVIHISQDCGESWKVGLGMTFQVNDLAWVVRETVPVLLLATEKGLYELAIHERAEPFQVLVEPEEPSLGFYAVSVSTDVWGGTSVAVASRGDKGIYLSNDGGKSETFHFLGLKGEMVRQLAFQHYSAHRYLWACTTAIGNDPGKACFRWRMTGAEENPEGWRHFDREWNAGGCHGIAFYGPIAFAASHRSGVLHLDITDPDAKWEAPTIKCNLPLRGPERLFQPVEALAVDPITGCMFAAGLEGIYRTRDYGTSYEHVSSSIFFERVTLPRTWLFCSDEHELEVEKEDETR